MTINPGDVFMLTDMDHGGDEIRVVVLCVSGLRVEIRPLFQSESPWSQADVPVSRLRPSE